MKTLDIKNGDYVVSTDYKVFVAVCDGKAAVSSNRYWSVLPQSFEDSRSLLCVGTPTHTNTLEKLEELFKQAAKENRLYQVMSYWMEIKEFRKIEYSMKEIADFLNIPEEVLVIKDSIKKAY